MAAPAERLRPVQHTIVDRLLTGNDTLYGRKPLDIAILVKSKLNDISASGRAVYGASSLPDYHTVGGDGGVKDIFFFTRYPLPTDKIPAQWETTTISQSNKGTYDGVKTSRIEYDLATRLADLEAEGKTVGPVISIDDYHNSAIGQGIGGFDGLKDFVICYY